MAVGRKQHGSRRSPDINPRSPSQSVCSCGRAIGGIQLVCHAGAIRAALGATRHALVGGVVMYGLGLAAAGAAFSIAASMAAGRAASSLIYEVTPRSKVGIAILILARAS